MKENKTIFDLIAQKWFKHFKKANLSFEIKFSGG